VSAARVSSPRFEPAPSLLSLGRALTFLDHACESTSRPSPRPHHPYATNLRPPFNPALPGTASPSVYPRPPPRGRATISPRRSPTASSSRPDAPKVNSHAATFTLKNRGEPRRNRRTASRESRPRGSSATDGNTPTARRGRWTTPTSRTAPGSPPSPDRRRR